MDLLFLWYAADNPRATVSDHNVSSKKGEGKSHAGTRLNKVVFPGQGALTHSAHTVAPHSLSAPHLTYYYVRTWDRQSEVDGSNSVCTVG